MTFKGDIRASDADKEKETTDDTAVYDSFNALDCQQCDYQAILKHHLKQHIQNIHEGLKYDCPNCDSV